ncbi:MAG: hypothetical protein ACRCW2_12915 [Cellulosilyticaceae bacterium]
MEAVILITLLVMCVIIVFILADNSWFKWEKTGDDAYNGEDYDTLAEDEDEMEDSFEGLEEDDDFEILGDTYKMEESDQIEMVSEDAQWAEEESDIEKE